MDGMVSVSLVTELLTKLEVEKDQWIYDTIKRFDGERYAGDQGLRSPEDRIIEIKDSEHSLCKEKKLNLERMEMELETLEEDVEENQRSLEDLEPTLDVLQKELALYESGAKSLDEIQFEKFRCGLDDQFTFDKKDQVVF